MQEVVKERPPQKACSIPIMFRTYPEGKFTEGVVNGPIEKIMISESKG